MTPGPDGGPDRDPGPDTSAHDTTPASPDHGELDDRAHEALLEFDYGREARARIVARSVRQEVGEISGDRTRATVERDGATVLVRVTASDLVALRAGANTWLTLVDVAEGCSDGA